MINSGAILEINTKNIIHNYKSLSEISSKSLTGATIKANAYGLGDLEIFEILYKYGCRHFFIATIEEAIKIRKKYSKGNIYILNGIQENEIDLIVKNNIIPIINSKEELIILNNNLKRNKKKFKIGLHIDTGLNRLGIKLSDLKILKLQNFKISILVSHLASSEEKNNNYNNIQNNNFCNSFKFFKKSIYKSISNSMGIIISKKFHHDLTRPGISLYGGHYNTKLKKIIKPVIKLKAKVLQIKELEKNEYVGYNQTYKASKSLTIAILAIGYADGISRKLSNTGKVFYKKRKFNIIGRVSMDTITIDITKFKKNIKIGAYLEVINYEHDIEKIAEDCGTISNEILTSISKRVKRVYV